MSKVVLTRPHEVEMYHVDADCDSFTSAMKLGPFSALELAAYYRGENVTVLCVEKARSRFAFGDAPLPIKSVGRLFTFHCTDGEYKCYYASHANYLDIGTLCRYFELIADLYELDPNVSEITVPFPRRTVEYVIARLNGSVLGVSLDAMLPLLLFLRLKSIYYFRFDCNCSKELELLKQLAREMPPEWKSRHAKYAHIVTDDSVWPLLSVLNVHTSDWEEYALVKLLEDRPCALLAVLCLKPYYNNARVLELLSTSTFHDKLETCITYEDSLAISKRISETLLTCTDLALFRKVLCILGKICVGYDNLELEFIHPFCFELVLDSPGVDEAYNALVKTKQE